MLFVILGLFFFTASFQATKGIKIAIVYVVSLAAKDFSGDHTNVQLTTTGIFSHPKRSLLCVRSRPNFHYLHVFFLSCNWRFKNTHLLIFKNSIESFPKRVKIVGIFRQRKVSNGADVRSCSSQD